ncbi:hypothetical protein IWQ61_007482 [Dispira simplex]|nr:hypothetical protein IWQ61_007482 [Dispira simplex]
MDDVHIQRQQRIERLKAMRRRVFEARDTPSTVSNTISDSGITPASPRPQPLMFGTEYKARTSSQRPGKGLPEDHTNRNRPKLTRGASTGSVAKPPIRPADRREKSGLISRPCPYNLRRRANSNPPQSPADEKSRLATGRATSHTKSFTRNSRISEESQDSPILYGKTSHSDQITLDMTGKRNVDPDGSLQRDHPTDANVVHSGASPSSYSEASMGTIGPIPQTLTSNDIFPSPKSSQPVSCYIRKLSVGNGAERHTPDLTNSYALGFNPSQGSTQPPTHGTPKREESRMFRGIKQGMVFGKPMAISPAILKGVLTPTHLIGKNTPGQGLGTSTPKPGLINRTRPGKGLLSSDDEQRPFPALNEKILQGSLGTSRRRPLLSTLLKKSPPRSGLARENHLPLGKALSQEQIGSQVDTPRDTAPPGSFQTPQSALTPLPAFPHTVGGATRVAPTNLIVTSASKTRQHIEEKRRKREFLLQKRLQREGRLLEDGPVGENAPSYSGENRKRNRSPSCTPVDHPGLCPPSDVHQVTRQFGSALSLSDHPNLISLATSGVDPPFGRSKAPPTTTGIDIPQEPSRRTDANGQPMFNDEESHPPLPPAYHPPGEISFYDPCDEPSKEFFERSTLLDLLDQVPVRMNPTGYDKQIYYNYVKRTNADVARRQAPRLIDPQDLSVELVQGPSLDMEQFGYLDFITNLQTRDTTQRSGITQDSPVKGIYTKDQPGRDGPGDDDQPARRSLGKAGYHGDDGSSPVREFTPPEPEEGIKLLPDRLLTPKAPPPSIPPALQSTLALTQADTKYSSTALKSSPEIQRRWKVIQTVSQRHQLDRPTGLPASFLSGVGSVGSYPNLTDRHHHSTATYTESNDHIIRSIRSRLSIPASSTPTPSGALTKMSPGPARKSDSAVSVTGEEVAKDDCISQLLKQNEVLTRNVDSLREDLQMVLGLLIKGLPGPPQDDVS